MYLFGGFYGSSASSIYQVNTICVFDTDALEITTLSVRLPQAAAAIASAAIGTKIYLFGGTTGSKVANRSVLDTIIMFDTETNAITPLSIVLPATLCGAGAGVIGTRIYLFGGQINSNYESTDMINKFYIEIMSWVAPEGYRGAVLIQDVNRTHKFNLINSETKIVQIGVDVVYRVDDTNMARLESAYLHNGTTWELI